MQQKPQPHLGSLYDGELRKKLLTDATAHVGEISGRSAEPGVTYKAVASTKDTIYIAIPHHSALLSIDDIGSVNAAGKVSSASTVATGGSAGTICTTFSSAGSVGSLGSAGSAA